MKQNQRSVRGAVVEDPIVLVAVVGAQFAQLSFDLARVRKRECCALFLQQLDECDHLRSAWNLQPIQERPKWAASLVLVELNRPRGQYAEQYTRYDKRRVMLAA